MTRFSRFQLAGWAAYALAMTFSRVGRFPFEYMVVSKGLLAVLGFLGSLVLWRLYRRLWNRGLSIPRLVVIAVVASYGLALAWTAVDNLADIPISALILRREVRIDGLGGLFGGSVYNSFTLLAWSVSYFAVKHHDGWLAAREAALRAEAAASRARLEALRYQLQPHLLFNTLNGISTLVVERKTAEATRMLARLSDFLRLILATPAGDQIDLAAEVDLIERYLDIERTRFGDRLTTSIEVGESAWRAAVPPLLLQPVVENAIRHGIAPQEGPGELQLRIERSAARLRMTVIDRAPESAQNGRGVAAAPGPSIGLANVRERLERLYGGDFSMTIEPIGGGAGTRVAIEIPFRSADG